MKGRTDEEKADRLVAHLNTETFEYYFDHFNDDNAPTKEAKSFQLVKKALLEKFSRKKKESETIKEAVNLTYKGEDVKEFFVRAKKLYKEANFNEGTKHGMIMEAIKSDQSSLQFVLLRKVITFDDVKETCPEYAEHQKMYSLPNGVIAKPSGMFEIEHDRNSQDKNDEALDKMDILCKKFEDLALLITKSKLKPKKTRHNLSQVQEAGSLCKSVPGANRCRNVLQLLWKIRSFGSSMLQEAGGRSERKYPDPEHAEIPDIEERSCSAFGTEGRSNYVRTRRGK